MPVSALNRLHRRAWFQGCLATLAARGLFASAPPDSTYLRLKKPLSIPVATVKSLWQPYEFSAWVVKPASGGTPAVDRLLKGVLLRVAAGSSHEDLEALCLHCPHELCYVQLFKDPGTVRLTRSPRPANPLMVCPCHFSVFDPKAAGGLLQGPADRGLFRFRFEMRDDVVEVLEVEQAAVL